MVVLELKHPEHVNKIHRVSIFYVNHWKNLPAFTKRVLSGEIKQCIVLVDSTKILNTNHLQTAIYNAFFSCKSNKRLRAIQTQILYNLSDSKNISQSLSTFGAKENECFLIAVDNEVTVEQIQEWATNTHDPLAADSASNTTERRDSVEIVESLQEMDECLKNNGSMGWIRDAMFEGKQLSRKKMESLLITMLSVKDI